MKQPPLVQFFSLFQMANWVLIPVASGVVFYYAGWKRCLMFWVASFAIQFFWRQSLKAAVLARTGRPVEAGRLDGAGEGMMQLALIGDVLLPYAVMALMLLMKK